MSASGTSDTNALLTVFCELRSMAIGKKIGRQTLTTLEQLQPKIVEVARDTLERHFKLIGDALELASSAAISAINVWLLERPHLWLGRREKLISKNGGNAWRVFLSDKARKFHRGEIDDSKYINKPKQRRIDARGTPRPTRRNPNRSPLLMERPETQIQQCASCGIRSLEDECRGRWYGLYCRGCGERESKQQTNGLKPRKAKSSLFYVGKGREFEIDPILTKLPAAEKEIVHDEQLESLTAKLCETVDSMSVSDGLKRAIRMHKLEGRTIKNTHSELLDLGYDIPRAYSTFAGQIARVLEAAAVDVILIPPKIWSQQAESIPSAADTTRIISVHDGHDFAPSAYSAKSSPNCSEFAS